MFKKIFVVLFMLFAIKAYAGADVNVQDKEGFTPLMWAILKNTPDVVKELVDAGADVNMQNKYGVTALMVAVALYNTDIVKVLINNGADVNIRSINGWTAYKLAMTHNTPNPDILKMLKDAGAK